MKVPVAVIAGVVVLSAVLQGCCCSTELSSWQWAPNPRYPDFAASGSGADGVGTARVRLVVSAPEAVSYWRTYGTATAKEVVAYVGLVEVGRTTFDPGATGNLEVKMPPGKYWLRLAGNSLTVTTTDDGREKVSRFFDREATVPVEITKGKTTTVTVDYSCIGYPIFAAL
jgi:hypothetical protein